VSRGTARAFAGMAASALALVVVGAALLAPTVPAAPADGIVRVPCRPVGVAGRLECTGTADIPPGTRLVILEPAAP
jgi:hypothetical protein